MSEELDFTKDFLRTVSELIDSNDVKSLLKNLELLNDFLRKLASILEAPIWLYSNQKSLEFELGEPLSSLLFKEKPAAVKLEPEVKLEEEPAEVELEPAAVKLDTSEISDDNKEELDDESKPKNRANGTVKQ